MANSSTPFGFMPYGRLNGGSPTEELTEVPISSADTTLHFTGDLVALSTIAGARNVLALSSNAGIGFEDGNLVPYGVFWGCKFFSAGAGRTVWSRFFNGTAVSGARAYLITDPNVLYRCVGGAGDGGAGATFVDGDIGNNLRCISSQSSQGNQTTGQSVQLVSSALTLDTSAAWRIVDLLANRSPAGTPGTDAAAFNQIIVSPNQWGTRAGTVAAST